MDGLNRVMLLGNLGADPELRMTGKGQAVLNMRLATTESYLDTSKTRQERTEWHTVVLWGKRAEALGKLLRKGDRLLVEGGLRTSSYEDREGNKRYKTEVVATNVILNGQAKPGASSGARGSRNTSAEPDDGPGAGAPSYGDGDDDIPF